MLREKPPSVEAERRDFDEQAKEALSSLETVLQKEGLELLKDGFPVEKDNCRIDPKRFIGHRHYPEAAVKRDEKFVEERRKTFARETPEAVTGELLETAKTVAVNRFWFDRRFLSVRTCFYDDYANGVDELIFDTETREPLAAVDTTTNPLNAPGKKEKLLAQISQGARLKYGLALSERGLENRSYNSLPLFIITIEPEKLLALARQLAGGTYTEEISAAEKNVFSLLKTQCREFQKIAGSRDLKSSYQRIETALQQIRI